MKKSACIAVSKSSIRDTKPSSPAQINIALQWSSSGSVHRDNKTISLTSTDGKNR